jgi:hypothetical protein
MISKTRIKAGLCDGYFPHGIAFAEKLVLGFGFRLRALDIK